jgi:hypothetical protein
MHERFSRYRIPAIIAATILLILAISIAWDREAREASTPDHGASPFFLPLGAY